MNTPWGDITVSDAHVHFFSHRFFTLLAAQKPGLTVDAMGELLGWQMPGQDPAQLAERWADELSSHHVQRAALIASLPGDEASVEAAGGTLEPVEGRKGRLISTFPKDPVRFPEGKVSEKVGAGDQVLSADLLFWADEAAVAGLKAKLLDAMAAKYV